MAYGKKNTVNLDILSYAICILGESKVGKTTLVKQICEQLAPEEGSYLFLELGQERGADAIEGINYVNCPEWNMDYDELTNSVGFLDVCTDIIENKTTEYPNLRVIIWDTYDQLIDIAEKEIIRLWNKECRESGHPEKCTKSINAVYGGFGKGEKAAMKLMFDVKAELKKVGVETLVIGHVKNKVVNDIASGESYEVLTSDQQQNYFNHLKKNLHFLALAYIDREIIKEKTGKKNPVTKKDETVSKVKSEARRIKFRDDNYAVDSGSRFADIVPEIPLDANEFIKALQDAITAESKKSKRSIEEIQKEQENRNTAEKERIAQNEKNKRLEKELDEIKTQIVEFFTNNKSNLDLIKPVLEKCKELGYSNPKEIDDIENAKTILAATL